MEKLVFFENTELTPIFDTKEREKISFYLQKQFASFLNQETFEIVDGYKKDQIQITLTLSNTDTTFRYPVESVFVYDAESDEKSRPAPHNIVLIMLDYLTTYFEEFLSKSRDVYLPLNWGTHQHENLSFFLRGFPRNAKLEQEADALLAKHGHGERPIFPISSEL